MSSISGLFSSLSTAGQKSLLHPSETAGTFASDIMRRVGNATTDEAATAAVPGDAEKKLAQKNQLESALAGTVNYMADTFGEKAGTAMMALVYKRIGDGEVTEESLGNAFLDVTRFIDNNFGTDKGDAFIDHLNGTLNDSLNAYFDNGVTERFLAVTVPVSSLASGVTSDMAADISKKAADSILALLEAVRSGKQTNPDAPYTPQQAQPAGLLLDELI